MKKPDDAEKFWSNFSETYASSTEYYTAPLNLQLAMQTKAHQAKSVLEVACGSGIGSLTLVPLLKPGTVYCCTDFSRGMLELMKKRYDHADFIRNPDNLIEFCLDDVIEKYKPKEESTAGVTLKAFKGNNEKLPFFDESFDSYIATASLYIVDSAPNMIKECYRVLKKGGLAGFNVIGREKESPYTYLGISNMQKYATELGLTLPKPRSYFYLGKDEAALVQMLKDAGFSKVKLWHEYGIFAMTAKEYAETKRIAAGKLLAVFPPEVQQKICKEIEEEVQKRFVDGNELITIDFIMLLCTK